MILNRSVLLTSIMIAGISCTTYTMEDPGEKSLIHSSIQNTALNTQHKVIDDAESSIRTVITLIQQDPNNIQLSDLKKTFFETYKPVIQKAFDIHARRAEEKKSWFKRNFFKTLFGFGILTYASRPFIEHHAPLVLKKITAAMIVVTKSVSKNGGFKN